MKDIKCTIDQDVLRRENAGILAYINEIKKIPLLTAEEERDLAVAAQRGDKTARERIIQANLRLVKRIANGYIGHGLELADLIQDGNIGLLAAVNRFDPSRGFRFSTYATWRIRQSITKGLIDAGRLIRLPCHTTEAAIVINRTVQKFQQIHERPPETEEISRLTGLPKEKIEKTLHAVNVSCLYSLEQKIEDSEKTILTLIADEDAADPQQIVCQKETKARLHQAVKRLTPREQTILMLRFGLNQRKEHSLEDIGRILGLSRERVRQIVNKSLEKIHSSMKNETGVSAERRCSH